MSSNNLNNKILDLINDVDNNKKDWKEFKVDIISLLEKEIKKEINSEKSIETKKKANYRQKDYSNIKPLVEVKNLTKHYKGRTRPAINNISFNIYPGEFHAFIGANGAGKTTTIKSIIGAYSKYKLKGEILINGQDHNLIEVKKLVGYIPENAKFPKKMALNDYLYLMTRLSGYSSQESKKRVKEILEDLKLTSLKNKRPNDFSSGQKKRVLLAQALVHNPQILIMDEPAANLDPIARMDLFNQLVELKEKGKAIFISSHILDEIGKYATYCTILDGGKVVYNEQLKNDSDLSEIYSDYVKKGSVDAGIVTKEQKID